MFTYLGDTFVFVDKKMHKNTLVFNILYENNFKISLWKFNFIVSNYEVLFYNVRAKGL